MFGRLAFYEKWSGFMLKMDGTETQRRTIHKLWLLYFITLSDYGGVSNSFMYRTGTIAHYFDDQSNTQMKCWFTFLLFAVYSVYLALGCYFYTNEN